MACAFVFCTDHQGISLQSAVVQAMAVPACSPRESPTTIPYLVVKLTLVVEIGFSVRIQNIVDRDKAHYLFYLGVLFCIIVGISRSQTSRGGREAGV